MDHAEFRIGTLFWCGDRLWHCTDVGSRVIVAIRIDALELNGDAPGARRILTQDEAEADSWFNGPPYAVAEDVFDEDDLKGCTWAPMSDSS
jgi:hypothetical protein